MRKPSNSHSPSIWLVLRLPATHVLLGYLVMLSASPVVRSSSNRSPCTHEYCGKQNAIFEWVEANGGYVNPKVELTTGRDPSWTIRGVFATAPISNEEKVFMLPSNLTLCGATFCALVASLSSEISLGTASFWWPYLSILEDHDIDLPYVWTDDERDLLSGLHPRALATSSAHGVCDMIDMSDETNLRAFQLVCSRAAGENPTCLIPLFDSINHAQKGHENSKLTVYNRAKSRKILDPNVFSLLHSIDEIAEKHQLFDSFGDHSFYRLYRSYGFFSQYPRLWAFENDAGREISFRIFEHGEGYDFNFNPKNVPYQKSMLYMYHIIMNHLATVLGAEPLGFKQKSRTINSERYAAALQYRQEYIKAFQMASNHLLLLVGEQKAEPKSRSPCMHEYCHKQNSLFEWVELNGGSINSKIELTTRGVIATAPINKGESIFWLPPNLLLCSAVYCDLVAAVSNELSLGQMSFWRPYLSILGDQVIDLPYSWADEERNLLSGLYPNGLTTSSAQAMCGMLDMNNETTLRAIQLVGSRNAGVQGQYNCMIPIFGSLNFAQLGVANFALRYSEGEMAMGATDNIIKKQQLIGAINVNDSKFYVLFHDYGFFSQYPRLWGLEDDAGREISFRIYEHDDSYTFDFNPYKANYQNDMFYMHQMFTNHLATVLGTRPIGFKRKSPTVRSDRYATALAYRQEYIKDFQMATDYLRQSHQGDKENDKTEL